MPLERRFSKVLCQDGAEFLPRTHPVSSQKPVKIVKLNPIKKAKHYLYIKSDTYEKQREAARSTRFENGGVYLTPFEREKMEVAESKKKFLAGDFRRHSGVASAIPLRKEGAVRACGIYLPPLQQHPKDLQAPLFGVWHPPTQTSSLSSL